MPPTPTLRVRLSTAAERAVRHGHPWVFADSIRSQTRAGQPGELAVIFNRDDRFLAVGLFDPGSPIRIRVLHSGKPAAIDAAFWTRQLAHALTRRAGIADATTDGLRLVNGESDGFPGLIADRYADTLVLKIYSAAWFPHLPALRETFHAAIQPQNIVLRLSRNIREHATRAGHPADGTLLHGPPVQAPVVFHESGLKFYADVVRGQKTGFFLDQRDNRRRVEGLAGGQAVLNLFSFTGGFSLYAARGGASHVTSLDLSAHALEGAEANWSLNPELRCPRESFRADALEWLQRPPGHYGLVISDPPSFARRESERQPALRAYEKLIALAARQVAPGGTLVCASCSAHVTEEEFATTARRAARSGGRDFREFDRTGHAPDHPATIPEMRYLKAIFLREHA